MKYFTCSSWWFISSLLKNQKFPLSHKYSDERKHVQLQKEPVNFPQKAANKTAHRLKKKKRALKSKVVGSRSDMGAAFFLSSIEAATLLVRIFAVSSAVFTYIFLQAELENKQTKTLILLLERSSLIFWRLWTLKCQLAFLMLQKQITDEL